MLNKFTSELKKRGVDFIKMVDISMLSVNENRGYSSAILIGMALSPSYIFRLSKENILDYSEFSEREAEVDVLAEFAADFIKGNGYKAYAQLPVQNKTIVMPKCNECSVCKNICPAKVILKIAALSCSHKAVIF